MEWKRVPKENSAQPVKGTYKDWKELLAEESYYQCVYCALHEARFGGIRNFHVEHYRPKSKFKELENDFKNLFYACSICNVFKSDDWPDEPKVDLSNASYPNPSHIDYNNIFFIIKNTGIINGKYIAAKYLVEKLFLNRPQLIIERKAAYLYRQLEQCKSYIAQIIDVLNKCENEEAKPFLARIAKLTCEILDLLVEQQKIRPYMQQDIKRNGNAT
jgi:hypothetical protein